MQRQCLDGPINSYHSFWWSNLILCINNVDILNICMKNFGSQKIIIDKMTAMRYLDNFSMLYYKGGYACSIIVHTRADQLLSQLLLEHFDTLPTQYRHIEHMHEGVWFPKKYYWQSGSYENFEIFFRLGCRCMHRQCLNGPINLYQSFWWNNSILCLHNVDTFNICIKEFYSKMIIIDKMTAIGT